MSIPLDRLYHYIDRLATEVYNNDVVIYRFWPHGSKKFEDLYPLNKITNSWKQFKITPHMYCNDQEPLNFDLYNNILPDQITHESMRDLYTKYGVVMPVKNFRKDTFSLWDKALLLHSEQRSTEVEKYNNCDFIPVYYWSHAVIARDWFRYAENIDQQKSNNRNLFLIYSQGWTGTREYRLKFLELVAKHSLASDCKIGIKPVDMQTGEHYESYNFQNTKWKPTVILENYFPLKQNICAESSADFDLADYESTDIEVVLETLFDDSRLHFTEKILRPIALGQPFVLMGAHDGLEYLKSYGFKTFSSIWSENYDNIQDPERRMQAVIKLMNDIKNWNPEQKSINLTQAQDIARHNKQRFFSDDFFKQIKAELANGLNMAFQELENTNTAELWYNFRKTYGHVEELQNELLKIRSQKDADEVYALAEKYHLRHQNNLLNKQT